MFLKQKVQPFVVNQDPGKNSSQSPPQIDYNCCYSCGDPLEGIFCHQCTCELCGNGAHYGYNCPPKVPIIPNPEPFNNQTIKELPPTVQSFDPKSDLVHDSPNVFDPPPQLPFYSCKVFGKDARYGHYCKPQVPFVYPEPCYNQDFKFPQEFQGFHDFNNNIFVVKITGLLMKLTNQITVNHPIFNTQNDLFDPQTRLMEQLTSMCDMVGQFIQKKKEEKQIEKDQAANACYRKIHACYDDDDDYKFAITPDEPDNSLNFSKEIYSNPMFDEEIISIKIDPHHFNAESDFIESLLNHDSSIISSSKIDSLFDNFASELAFLKSILPGIDETDCYPEEETHFIKRLLYDNSSPRPPEEFVFGNSDAEIESFSPSHIPVEDSSGLAWLFDIDSLTQTMNYLPVTAENQTNTHADVLVDGKEHDDNIQKSVSLDIHSSSSGARTRNLGDNTKNKDKGKSPVVTIIGFRDLNEEFEECINNSSNGVNAASSLVSAAGLNLTNNTNDFSAAGPSNTAASLPVENSALQIGSTSSHDADMPNLEDYTHCDDADDVG
nr:hypothetical protein [Tanacetum cinerariifolium]